MERYSDKAIEIINELHKDRIDYESEYTPLIDCANQCSAYEDIGMTPEEVTAMQYREIMRVINMAPELEGVPLDRLRELAEADRDGRLVVRPYRIGETVYALLKDGAIFYPETNGWYISEEIVGAISHDGFYLGDPVDDVYTPDSEIGKTVFLTKKAAKAALEAMKDETR